MTLVPDRRDEYVVRHDDETYVVRPLGDLLQVGRVDGDETHWLEIAVPVTQLGGEARRALEHGDHTCPALLIGLMGVVAAAVRPASAGGGRGLKGGRR
jgi:hypothetical protein